MRLGEPNRFDFFSHVLGTYCFQCTGQWHFSCYEKLSIVSSIHRLWNTPVRHSAARVSSALQAPSLSRFAKCRAAVFLRMSGLG